MVSSLIGRFWKEYWLRPKYSLKIKNLPKCLNHIVRLSKKHLTCWIKRSPLKYKTYNLHIIQGVKHGILSKSKRNGRGSNSPKNRLAYGK